VDDNELSMLSANKVYTTYCDTPIAPDNPKSLAEAQRSPEWPDWEKAVQAELNQLHKMGTWVLVNPPKERTPVSNKWVLTKKYDKEGNLLKFKARLVAKGYSQMPGMDYTDTFAPVVRLETIRTLLALALTENWEIQQMDVKGAYLNGKIKEELYMNQPKGYDDDSGRVCCLIKSLYGLKQAGREWNLEFNQQLESHGWTPSMVDPCCQDHVQLRTIIRLLRSHRSSTAQLQTSAHHSSPGCAHTLPLSAILCISLDPVITILPRLPCRTVSSPCSVYTFYLVVFSLDLTYFHWT